ncbi:MAG: endonuclease/exonuclease/phosphatase family protein [Chloroflexota bacterium]|nr:endonuclease/exonuclease/phosphatase family protein [Chloroflexota bacterium]
MLRTTPWSGAEYGVPEATRVRLVTINTAKEEPPYHGRIALLAAGLARLEPDLVLLQETVNTPDGRFNTTLALGDALGMTALAVPARRKLRRIEDEVVDAWSGLGLLSRLPIAGHERLALPTDPRDGERIALLARIDAGRGELLIVNTHLTHLRDAADLRRRQIAAIAAHPWLSRPWQAAILGGDLNTPLPELPSLLAALGEHHSWVDTYIAGGGMEPRVTMPSYWASAENRCLDYLISLAWRAHEDPRFTDSAVVLAEPDAAGTFPSDHRGVMTTLHLGATP